MILYNVLVDLTTVYMLLSYTALSFSKPYKYCISPVLGTLCVHSPKKSTNDYLCLYHAKRFFQFHNLYLMRPCSCGPEFLLLPWYFHYGQRCAFVYLNDHYGKAASKNMAAYYVQPMNLFHTHDSSFPSICSSFFQRHLFPCNVFIDNKQTTFLEDT